MNYLDLFHGIGGFALGAYMAGMKFDNHFCSDIKLYCVKLYALRFPDSVQLGDITKINFEKLKNDYPGEWIITGGFPCQPFSQAGKGLKENDKRNLWPETKRAFRQLKPVFAIFENVIGAFKYIVRTVLPDIEMENYKTETIIFPASAIGGPHQRKRIFIITYPYGYGLERKYPVSSSKKIFPRWWIDIKRMACKVQQGKINSIPESWIIRKGSRLSEDVDRLKGLGNSIVPQIACLLFQLIKELMGI